MSRAKHLLDWTVGDGGEVEGECIALDGTTCHNYGPARTMATLQLLHRRHVTACIREEEGRQDQAPPHCEWCGSSHQPGDCRE